MQARDRGLASASALVAEVSNDLLFFHDHVFTLRNWRAIADGSQVSGWMTSDI